MSCADRGQGSQPGSDTYGYTRSTSLGGSAVPRVSSGLKPGWLRRFRDWSREVPPQPGGLAPRGVRVRGSTPAAGRRGRGGGPPSPSAPHAYFLPCPEAFRKTTPPLPLFQRRFRRAVLPMPRKRRDAWSGRGESVERPTAIHLA